MDVELDELNKRANTPNVKNHGIRRLAPTYLSMGYPVYECPCYFLYMERKKSFIKNNCY